MYFNWVIHLVLSHWIVFEFVVAAVTMTSGRAFLGQMSGHSYVYVGDALDVTCVLGDSLLEQGFTAENISFKVSHKLTTECCTDKHILRVINRSTAVISIPNVFDTGKTRYTCLVGSHHCDNGNSDLLLVVNVHNVSVQYRPHNVTNFDCVEYDVLNSITCTWQHPVTYNKDLGDTEVTFSSNITHAACTDLNFFRCTLKNPRNYEFVATITVTNRITNYSASSDYMCDTSNKLQLSPVTNLSIEKVIGQDGCFQLSWRHDKKYQGKIYRVSHQGPDSAKPEIIGNNLSEMKYNICGLRPFTPHNFSVQCYPDNRKGYWSEPTYLLDYWTPEQAPSLGPETTYGSFSSTSCIKMENYRITLFWKEVQRSARYGLITNYVVKLGGGVLSKVDSNSYTDTFELSCKNSPVDIEIAAVNSAGESNLISIIKVSSLLATTVVHESFSIALNGSRARALWKTSDQNNNENATIFWCHEREQSCKGPIAWIHVNESQSYLDIPELPSEPLTFKFGIARKDKIQGFISGIHWTNCFYNHQPSNLASPEIRDVEPGDESATVVWNEIKCTKTSKIKLTGYRVMWCEHNKCKAHLHTVDLPTGTSSYRVSGLQSSTNYKVTVLSVVDELMSQTYVWKDMTPTATENISTKILIIVFVSLAVVIIGTLVIKFAQYCCISKQKMNNLLTEVESQNADLANHRKLENVPHFSHSESSEPLVKTARYLPSKSKVLQCNDNHNLKLETAYSDAESMSGCTRNRVGCLYTESNIDVELDELDNWSSSVADYTLCVIKQDVPSLNNSDEKTDPLNSAMLCVSEEYTKMESDMSAMHSDDCEIVLKTFAGSFLLHMLPQWQSSKSSTDDNIIEKFAPRNCHTLNHMEYISVSQTNLNHRIIAQSSLLNMSLQNLSL